MPAILLSGRPGIGKTTIIRDVVGSLAVAAGGFYTEEVRAAGRRLGFDLVTLDGRRATLSSVHSRSRLRVSRYGVEIDALEGLGASAIHSAVAEARLIVIDEIGKMELYSDGFRQAVLAALDSGKPVLGTIMLGSHPFADLIRRRPDVEVFVVREENRAELPREIVARLRRLLDALPGGGLN